MPLARALQLITTHQRLEANDADLSNSSFINVNLAHATFDDCKSLRRNYQQRQPQQSPRHRRQHHRHDHRGRPRLRPSGRLPRHPSLALARHQVLTLPSTTLGCTFRTRFTRAVPRFVIPDENLQFVLQKPASRKILSSPQTLQPPSNSTQLKPLPPNSYLPKGSVQPASINTVTKSTPKNTEARKAPGINTLGVTNFK